MYSGSNLLLGSATIPRQAKKSLALTVNNTTGSQTIWTLTGSVLVLGLWGEVTTVLSSAITAAFLELYDQTASPDITLATGVALSSEPVGSILYKDALTGAALKAVSSAAGFFAETTPAGQPFFTPFLIGKKSSAVTVVRMTYTTTNAPATGVILWNALWIPLSADGNLS